MVFPATPLDMDVEMFIDGEWVNVTSHVYLRGDGVTIGRGRSSEASHVERSTSSMQLNNRSGRYSPRNPTGLYYGQIGRNTPLRVSLHQDDAYFLTTPNSDEEYVSTPDHATLDITGDIDVRIELEMDNWRATHVLMSKWDGFVNQQSWRFVIGDDGLLYFHWSTTGANTVTAVSTAVVPALRGSQALRATLDVNVGGTSKTVTFYTSDSIGGTWTQLGSAVTTAGTTSIFSSSAPVTIGSDVSSIDDGARMKIYAASVRSGIAGSEVANPNFRAQADGATSFADSAGRTWTVEPGKPSEITDRRTRFHGEVSEWPQKSDTTGRDVWTPIEASGILRRLSQGASPIRSVMYRSTMEPRYLAVAYWPAEEGSTATSIASAFSGHPIIKLTGSPDFASFSDFVSSDPIPYVQQSKWIAPVPGYTDLGAHIVRFLLRIPAGELANNTVIASIYTKGTVARWELRYQTGGALDLRAYDSGGSDIGGSSSTDLNLHGQTIWVQIGFEDSGSSVDWRWLTMLTGGGQAGLGASGTLASRQVTGVASVVINPNKAGLGETAVGHIAVISDNIDFSLADDEDQLNGYNGELAATRLKRLCDEEGIYFSIDGDGLETQAMGPQENDTLVNILRGCAETDGGILYEPRETFGIAYITREALYNQDATLTLDYSAKELSTLEPTEDDQGVTNDVTVTRRNGSSARATLDEGVLSTQDPPDGIGKYDTAITINPETDDVLPDQARWRVHVGTVDDLRYRVEIELHRDPFVDSATLRQEAIEVDVGDRLVVENPPSWLPPDDISQLAQGFTENLSNFLHTISINCSPESPYGRVGVYDEDTTTQSRYSSDGSTISEDLTTTETDVSVATPSGPLWTTDSGEMPFDIRVGGEVMRVTAISGASSPQVFTVTRSVNGVVKTHSTGAEVTLDQPAVYAI